MTICSSEPFEDEIHPRLRFAHRGLVAMANNGTKNSNDSQFIITLGVCQRVTPKNILSLTSIVKTAQMNYMASTHYLGGVWETLFTVCEPTSGSVLMEPLTIRLDVMKIGEMGK